jgi:phosphonate transport system permease protein
MASELEVTRAPNRPATAPDDLRERLLSPWPRLNPRVVLAAVVAILAMGWGLEGTNASPTELLAGAPNIADFITRLFPPRWDMQPWAINVPAPLHGVLGAELAPVVPRVVPYLIETLQMALIGTLLGVILSVPFGLLAARNVAPHPLIYQATRLLLNINRAIPDIIFALIFVAAVGLGPFGGVLALAVGSVGSLAKLYAESIEAIDPQQVAAVRATGASPLQAFIYGVAPQAMPLMASYSLLYFESNVRSATILGLVGAGGVGFILSKYISLFQYRELMGALIFIIVMVTVIDRVSDSLRKRLI